GRRSGDRAHGAWRGHAPIGDHRHASRHGVASAELAPVRRVPATWCDNGQPGLDRTDFGMTPTTTYPDPTLFGHDPLWLIALKAVGIFAFLMLSLLVAILLERKILGYMQM